MSPCTALVDFSTVAQHLGNDESRRFDWTFKGWAGDIMPHYNGSLHVSLINSRHEQSRWKSHCYILGRTCMTQSLVSCNG